LFINHNPNADSLYGADISVHPEFRRKGIATMLYNVRKSLCVRLNLRRVIAGGRLYNYNKYAKIMSPKQYAKKAENGELKDPVISFQLKNDFKLIKVLPNYLYDKRSLNYAAFIEWSNPAYRVL
jgi:GNAT superfamily N-acetyltransferase